MKKFRVVIEETVSGEFEVNAETEEEALASARVKYKNSEFVLEPGEVEEVKISLLNNEDELISTEEL